MAADDDTTVDDPFASTGVTTGSTGASSTSMAEPLPTTPVVPATTEELEVDDLPPLRLSSDRRPRTPGHSNDSSTSALLRGHSREKREMGSGSSRTRSPFTRNSGHIRSHSSGTLPADLTRAHSTPSIRTRRSYEMATPAGSASSSPSVRSLPASPIRGSSANSSGRNQSPLRPSSSASLLSPEDGRLESSSTRRGWYETPPGAGSFEAIQEDSELDLTPTSQLPSLQTLVPRSSSLRRRPASPLHSFINAPQPQHPPRLPSFSIPENDQPLPMQSNPATPSYSGSSSPAPGSKKYDESYPTLHHNASSTSIASSYSSYPSTPTSARSRSPSISSLDTIEDVPDLESEAMELDRLERLQLGAEGSRTGEDDEGPRRRGSFDTPRGSGFTRGRSDQRKRWSVCGAERRADLDLETIWED